MTLRRILLALTVLGFVVPNTMVVMYLARNGLAVGDYFNAWFNHLPSTQITLDLLIVAVAFLIWAGVDGPRSGVHNWWWVYPATFLVGLCFGAPLYLLLRERALSALPAPPRTA